MCHILLTEIATLNTLEVFSNLSTPLPPTSYKLPFLLSSTSLLSLIQWRHATEHSSLDQTFHTSNLIENVLNFTFRSPNSSSNAANTPEPSLEVDNSLLRWQIFGQDLICCWSLCGGLAWSIVSKAERHWRPYLETFWNDALREEGTGVPPPSGAIMLPGVLLWHTLSRLTARGVLFSLLHRRMGSDHADLVQPCRHLLKSLLCWSRDDVSSVVSLTNYVSIRIF